MTWAVEAEFPLAFGHDFIQQTLIQQVFTGDNHSFRPIDDGKGCHYLHLHHPKVDSSPPYLKITAAVEVKIGQYFGDQCVSLLDWSGNIEMYESFVVADRATTIKAQIKKSELLDTTGSSTNMSNQLWQLINQYVHPRMERVVFNIKEPVAELKKFIPIVLPKVDKKTMIWMINTLWIKRVNIDKQGIQVTLKINIPSRYSKVSKTDAESPYLTDKEKQRVFKLLDELDVFYSQLIRQLALKKSEKEIQDKLFSIMLDFRHELIDIIDPESKITVDPVPQLFLDTWKNLRPVFKQLSQRENPFQESFRYLSFVTAVDVLPVLQKHGPAMGLEISTNGLIRLIQIVLPQLQDPLKMKKGVDQQLRDAFDLGEPPKSNIEVRQLNWLDWWITPLRATGLDPVTNKLINQFIPHRSNLKEYIPLAQKVIKLVSTDFLQKNKLKDTYHDVFKWTLLATAWKESCWRQYIGKKGQRKPLTSKSGAVGMMQVVPKVWRGFFDPYPLEWDAVYNLEAGTQILFRYMTHYAIRKGEHKRDGGVDNLARATYAAYNAGPGKLSRYRRKNSTRRQKRVDREFYKKYKKVKDGKSKEVKLCFG